MKFKILLLIATTLVLVGCKKEYVFNYADVAGRTFAGADVELKILSEDEATWTTSSYRDEPQTYLVNYEINSNEITFSVNDTISVNYVDTVFGTQGVIVYYYSDFFTGYFIEEDAIEATVTQSHRETWNGADISNSSAEWTVILHAK